MIDLAISPVALALAALFHSSPAPAAEVKCYTFQRGSGSGVADAYITDQQPAQSHGAYKYLLVGGRPSCEAASLLRFDLPDIPTSAIVTSAHLSLDEEGSDRPATLTVHRVTAAWDEDDATWASYGAAFDPYVEATGDTGGPDDEGPISFDVTELVQLWIDGSLDNEGVFIAQPPGARTRLSSSEHDAADRRPRLDVCFAVKPDKPGGPIGLGGLDGALFSAAGAGDRVYAAAP